MISRDLWQAGLVSPAILWAAFATSASTLAFELPTRTVAVQPQAANSSVTADSLMIASTSPNKLENSAVIDAETRVLVAQVSNTADQSDVLKPLNPYSNESSEQSLEQVKKDDQLRDTSVTDADASESNVLDQINSYSNESNDNSLDQVTNVTQLSDVQPNDWAYEALRSLVERYGCIAGYPDRTYRGNRALTRYEFAAGLNACLNQIERLITSSTADLVRRQDLETLQRLVQEFQPELRTLGSRVDKLEDRVAFLEDHQFST
ncbi:MAG: iron uptake porin, partial [Cyanobacteriota bacterium]|nr:iron uptake porin [Cyanobacteriota bacterium]